LPVLERLIRNSNILRPMTTVYHSTQKISVKKEVRQIQKTAEKVAVSKDSARRFLMSTGVYATNGKLKAQFR